MRVFKGVWVYVCDFMCVRAYLYLRECVCVRVCVLE